MQAIVEPKTQKLTQDSVRDFVMQFYRWADDNTPLVRFLPHIEDDFHMVWTNTCEFRGQEGFEEFWRNLTSNTFDRQHNVEDLEVTIDGDTAEANFLIHQFAKAWRPPLAHAMQEENFTKFRLTFRVSEKTGNLVIIEYLMMGVRFPEGSIIVVPDFAFKNPFWNMGPFLWAPEGAEPPAAHS